MISLSTKDLLPPEIVWVDCTCQAEGLLHQREAWSRKTIISDHSKDKANVPLGSV